MYIDEKLKGVKIRRAIYFGILLFTVISIIVFFIFKNIYISLSLFLIPFLFLTFDYIRQILKNIDRVKKIESIFPDFLQLMTSNLRAGLTIDRSIFLSAREEFNPLDKEILSAAKDIATGKTIEYSLSSMGKRIGSKKIDRVIRLITTGMKSGGNLATLLEETSIEMREKEFIEKRAVSNVTMYIIFIFLAASFGGPGLFALSSLLVEVLSKILSEMPAVDATSATPMILSKINISVDFIKYFSLVFIFFTDLFASLILGLISKGEEKQGLKYFIPLLIVSISIFFLARFLLSTFLLNLFF